MSSSATALARQEKRSTAAPRLDALAARRAPASDRYETIADASACASPDGVSRPPAASTKSATPPTSVETTGNPQAIASRITFGELSKSDDSTNRSAVRYHDGVSACGT